MIQRPPPPKPVFYDDGLIEIDPTTLALLIVVAMLLFW
jgi:hypothetical protein